MAGELLPVVPGGNALQEFLSGKVQTQKRRLTLYAIASFWEAAANGFALWIAMTEVNLAGLCEVFLVVPLVIVLVRMAVVLHLMRSFHIIGTMGDGAEAVRRLRVIVSSSCWLCSTASLTVFAALLTMWHGFWFLLILCHEVSADEAPTASFLSIIACACTAVNMCMWWSCERIVKDIPDKPVLDQADREWSNAIRLVPFKALAKEVDELVNAAAAEVKGNKQKVAPAPLALPEHCTICLEEFSPLDVVARLPCEHTFHPHCVHKWLRGTWQCPFRCSMLAKKVDVLLDLRPDAAVSYAWR